MSNKKVIVVTGSYKGIGVEIVRLLCEHYGDKASVFMTSRSETKAVDSLNKLRAKGLNPAFAELDITSQESVSKLRQLIESQHGGAIHTLINNAAISYGNSAPFHEQAEGTIKNNYFGHLNVCEGLFPILAPGGCVINVTGQMGSLRQLSSPDLQKMFAQAPDVHTVSKGMNLFVEKTKTNEHGKYGFSNNCLATSKLGVMAASRVHARELADRKISVFNMCPGWVQTDMAGYNAPMTAAEGADTIIWLETMDPNMQIQATGRFFKNRSEIQW